MSVRSCKFGTCAHLTSRDRVRDRVIHNYYCLELIVKKSKGTCVEFRPTQLPVGLGLGLRLGLGLGLGLGLRLGPRVRVRVRA